MNQLLSEKKILNEKGFDPVFISIYGSQNYGLEIFNDEYNSDLDVKSIVVPTLDDLVENSKGVSKVIDTNDGQADIKDIRIFMNTLLKGNPAYLETLFAKEYYIKEGFEEDFEDIICLGESLVYTLRFQMLRAIYGMMKEKEKALKHPYPSTANEIEKFGYSGKQAHHIYRLHILMINYYKNNYSFGESLNTFSKDQKEILDLLKLNKLDEYTVDGFVYNIMAASKAFKNDYLREGSETERTMNYDIKHHYENIGNKIIKNKIIDGLRV